MEIPIASYWSVTFSVSVALSEPPGVLFVPGSALADPSFVLLLSGLSGVFVQETAAQAIIAITRSAHKNLIDFFMIFFLSSICFSDVRIADDTGTSRLIMLSTIKEPKTDYIVHHRADFVKGIY